jgi:endogenous inhibitor of DNA gyrase (YacG/DUF329 family)
LRKHPCHPTIVTPAVTMPSRIVSCPQCGATVEWAPASKWRPFCSERCKLIDLGAWASESYRVPVAEPSQGDDTPTIGEADALRNRRSDP